jgi:Phage major tail protein 2.
MTVANSVHGEIRFNGQKIAKVTNVSLDIQRQVLDTTGIGEADDEFAYGKRSTSGSATLLYKTDDQATRQLMARVFEDDEEPDNMEIVLHKGKGRVVSGSVLMRSLGLSESVSENTSVNISFVVNGKPSYSI